MENAPNSLAVKNVALSERTLEARYYLDSSVMKTEQQDLLYRSWQFVGHISDVISPGDYFTFSLQNQDYFLVRDTDGTLRGYANVCPHRGHRLLDGQGTRARITCPYHAWTFGLDGALRGAKGMSRRDVDFEKLGLISIAVDILAGLVFVNPSSDAVPLRTYAPGLEGQMLRACSDLESYVPDREGEEFGHTYICRSNWKVMIDNYLECYHCQMAHPEFNEMMAIPESVFTLFPNFTYQNAPTKKKAQNLAFPLDLDHDVLVGEFWWLFPNITLGRFPGTQNFYVSRFDPLKPDETSRFTLSLKPATPTDAGAPERDRLRSVWTAEVVAKEDRSLCEGVQRGIAQKGFKQGWYVTNFEDHGISEHAMQHFHGLYRQWLAAHGSRFAD